MWHFLGKKSVKILVMAVIDEVAQFVGDDIFYATPWSTYQPRV